MDVRLTNIQVVLPNGRNLFLLKDLNISSGTRVLIRGRSGGGKTTLLHLMAGLFQPSSGHVKIGELELSKVNDRDRAHWRRRNVGVIFQKLNLLDHLSVRENVRLGLSGSAFDDDVERSLKQVLLSERHADRVVHLSLGEQQRVAVARVLAQNPALILADEPTSSLDADNADSVMRALVAAAVGKTLIVVSHDERLKDHFDRVIPFAELVE